MRCADEITSLYSIHISFVSMTAKPLSNTTQNPEAPPTTYDPPSSRTNGATEKIVSDPLEESQEELEARCHEIMKQVRPAKLYYSHGAVTSLLLQANYHDDCRIYSKKSCYS